MGGAKGQTKPKAKRRRAEHSTPEDRWRSLTWDDLRSWAGTRSVSRGRTYQRQGAVDHLAISSEGSLLATVQGTRLYATGVWLEQDQPAAEGLRSRCSCPVGFNGCKHAVAVVAEYLQNLADGTEVPVAEADDSRWASLVSEAEDLPPDDTDSTLGLAANSIASRPPQRHGQTGPISDEAIRRDIAGHSHEELVDLVASLADRLPELRRELQERVMLTKGSADQLVGETRREIREVTAEPGWWNPWEDEGSIPDYSRLKQRLERLIEFGQADAVVELGRELLDRGMEQIEQSHDEGETAMALSECLDTVFEGVERSSLSTSEQLIFAIDGYLRDDFDVIGDAGAKVLDAEHPGDDWSKVADELYRRLTAIPEPQGGREEFSRRYQRDQITNWLARALDHAGREDELLCLYEREADSPAVTNGSSDT